MCFGIVDFSFPSSLLPLVLDIALDALSIPDEEKDETESAPDMEAPKLVSFSSEWGP